MTGLNAIFCNNRSDDNLKMKNRKGNAYQSVIDYNAKREKHRERIQ